MQQIAVSRSTAGFDPEATLTVVVELSRTAWLVAALIPGIERRPLKKLLPNEEDLLPLLERWCQRAEAAGREIRRFVLAYEAGRVGFWLARWLRARGIEAHVIHASSVAVPRERRRAKTDRLDTALLMRVLLGWLRGESGHCSMAIVPDLDQEDAKRPNRERENLIGERTRVINRMKATLARLGVRGFNPVRRNAAEQLSALATPEAGSLPANTLAEMRRDMARLRLIDEQIGEIERERLCRLEEARPERARADAMVRALARVVGVGIETADMITHEVLVRDLRDRRAVARYAGLTGSPDESGSRQARARSLACGQSTGATGHGPTGVALPGVPEGERLGEMVSAADCRRARQDAHGDDRGPRAQALDRAVADGDDRRSPRGTALANGSAGGRPIVVQECSEHELAAFLARPRWRQPGT